MFVIEYKDYYCLHIFPNDDKQLWNNIYTFAPRVSGMRPSWNINSEVIDWLIEYSPEHEIQHGRRLVILFRTAEEIMAFKLWWM